jgi:hypothetical protein
MSEEELHRDVLDHVAIDRRSYVKKAIGGAFVPPVVASFPMKNADIDSAKAQGGNQTVPPA